MNNVDTALFLGLLVYVLNELCDLNTS